MGVVAFEAFAFGGRIMHLRSGQIEFFLGVTNETLLLFRFSQQRRMLRGVRIMTL